MTQRPVKARPSAASAPARPSPAASAGSSAPVEPAALTMAAAPVAPAAAPSQPTRPASERPPALPPTLAAEEPMLDLRRYVPAYLTWIANKLSRGASQHYLDAFGVGIETWRLLVLLAIEHSATAQHACRVIGMDKASVSRAFKAMQARGLITVGLDAADGRLRVATITSAGRALHDRIQGLALERERALLEVLAPHERDVLIGLLHRLHENLPAVEAATERYLRRRLPKAAVEARLRAEPSRSAQGLEVQGPDAPARHLRGRDAGARRPRVRSSQESRSNPEPIAEPDPS